ncbi:MAG: hypothetical protein H7Z13_18420 [Ferruginibacter sp.]|nr:hypothetical protein [Ferruginibacter sp.]
MKFGSSLTVSVLFVSLIAPGFSCKRNNNNASEDVVYYYPAKNIYYDSRHLNYYYSLDSARSWDSLAFKGSGYGSALGQEISLQRTGNNVWANNEAHRKAYNGVLLNIINNRTIAISRADSLNKLKIARAAKIEPAVIEKEAPPKKRLNKFFNKLFGKKKKQAKDKQP